jgi:hypothetical protein
MPPQQGPGSVSGGWGTGTGSMTPPSTPPRDAIPMPLPSFRPDFQKGNGQKYEGTTNAGGPNSEYAMQQQGGDGQQFHGGDPYWRFSPPEDPMGGEEVQNPQLPLPPRNPDGGIVPPPPPTTGRGGRGVRPGDPLPNPVTNQPAPPGPTDIANETYDQTVARYAATPGYEWIKDKPWAIQEYRDEMARTGSKADFVDWAAARFTDVASPLAGRAGFNSYTHNADGSLVGWNANSPTWGNNEFTSTKINTAVQDTTPGGPTRGADGRLSTGGAPTGTSTTTATSSGSSTPGNANSPDMEKYMQALFGRQSSELQRRLDAKGANAGVLQSGGHLQASADAQANLQAQQGGQLGDYLFQDAQSLREQELKKWLGNLQSQDSRYGADRGLDAAIQNATASQMGAMASANASKYNADLDYRLGTERLRYDDVFNQRGYDLGIFGINRDVYQTDQNNMRQYLQMLYGMSPSGQMNGLPFGLPAPYTY